jgi:hypothetical protein
MSSDGKTKNNTRPIEWVIVIVSIFNLIAVLYLARSTETFKQELTSARLGIEYRQDGSFFLIKNNSRVVATNILISVDVPPDFKVRVDDVDDLKPNVTLRDMSDYHHYAVRTEQLFPGQTIQIDILNYLQEPGPKTRIYAQITCSNCITSSEWSQG